MAESPKRAADVSRAEASRIAKPVKPAGPTGETARAADSVPLVTGPFATLPMQFGRYRIEKLLGQGAMGAVYLSHDLTLDRTVALKVAKISASGSAKILKRMETEARAAAKINHPQICKVHDSGEIDGIKFIALEYIEGEDQDFKAYLKRVGRRREPAEAVRLVLGMLRAMGAAHEKKVIHRDLKPDNVKLNEKFEPVIMDFGLARQATLANDAGLTQAGMVLGTAAYMSPEQAKGKGRADEIDERSDLYAMGVMLFEMLTGEWPFTGGAIEIMGQKCVCDAPSPLSLNPQLTPQLAAVCQKMIAKKKEDRYATCAEVVAALEAVDLNVPVALEMPVEFDEAPPPLDFLPEPPAAPGWHKPAKAGQQGRKASPIFRRLEPLAKWWRDQPQPFRWTMLGSAGACAVLLAAVLFFRSGDALVRVEVHADDVEVTFQNKTITLADGAHKFKVTPGLQKLYIKFNNVEFETDKFTLKRGDNPAVTVELVKSEIVTKLGEKEIGRRSLTPSLSGESVVKADFVFEKAIVGTWQFEGGSDDKRVIHFSSVTEAMDLATKRPARMTLDNSGKGTIWFPSGWTNTIQMQSATELRYEAIDPDGAMQLTGVGLKLKSVEEVLADYQKACTVADQWLVDEFDNESTFVRTQAGLKADEQHAVIDAIAFEKATFEKHHTIPFSPRMRAASIKYLASIERARKPALEAYEKSIAQRSSPQDEALISATNAEKALLAPKLVGVWDCTLPGHRFTWKLYSDGSAMPNNSSWTLDANNKMLVINHGPGAPGGGPWIDNCVFAANGMTFVARNQQGGGYNGKRADPSDKAAATKRVDALRDDKIDRRAITNGVGAWSIEGDELVQSQLVSRHSSLVFGSPDWSDYDFSFEAQTKGGTHGFKAVYHHADDGNNYLFALGNYSNQGHDVSRNKRGQWSRMNGMYKGGKIEKDRWYAVRVEVRGTKATCFLDGVRQFVSEDPEFSRGRCGVAVWESAARFRKLLVTRPDGTVLWKGLPDLPAAASK